MSVNNPPKVTPPPLRHLLDPSHRFNFFIMTLSAFTLLGIGFLSGYMIRGVNPVPDQRTRQAVEPSQARVSIPPMITIGPFPSDSYIISPVPTISSKITSNWKTYKNIAHHFSVQYPPDWTIDATRANAIEDYQDLLCCKTAYLTITNGKVTWEFIIDPVVTGFQPPIECEDASQEDGDGCRYFDQPIQVLGYFVNRTLARLKSTNAIVEAHLRTPGKDPAYAAFGRIGIENEYFSADQPKYTLWYKGREIENYLEILDSITLSLKTIR